MKLSVQIAGDKPTYLKSRIAWCVWRRAQALNAKNRMIEPTSYPCLAYTYINGEKEETPGYVYLKDVEKMTKALTQ